MILRSYIKINPFAYNFAKPPKKYIKNTYRYVTMSTTKKKCIGGFEMKTILLAEDNDNLRELITDFLSEHEFEVDAVADGEEAWQMVLTKSYQLILLDVMMPGMDGFTLCRKIRERESVPVLFLTARVLEEDQLRGYELGADDYILKPFSLRVLLAKCQVVLERYQRGTKAETQRGIVLNEERQQFFCDGKPVELQSLDYRLLSYFFKNPNRILTGNRLF